jgi:hypothetical protein
VAIFHLSVKPISRSAGRSATAAAAYRSAEKITDERTGEIHDYTRKGGVESTDLVLPDGAPEWASDRAKLWNAAELAEKRKDACVAREFEVALPAELSADERRRLVLDFARQMANEEGGAVDVAIHAPGKDGDNRNHHAHILRTTRKVEADGLGAKLDTEKAGRKRKDDLEAVRVKWATLTNAALERAGRQERVDHRSLEAQGIEREPTQHLGPAASALERRTGEVSRKRADFDQAKDQARTQRAGELASVGQRLDRGIQALSDELARAKADQARQAEARTAAAARDAAFKARFEEAFVLDLRAQGMPETLARETVASDDVQRRMAAARLSPNAAAQVEKLHAAASEKLRAQEEAKAAAAKQQAERDKEAAQADVWTQWGKAQVEARAEILGKWQADAKAGLDAVKAAQAAHEKAKPLLFGRQGWEWEREQLAEKVRIAGIRVREAQPGADGQLEYHREQELKAAAAERARTKQPELAQRADAAQQAWREEAAREQAQRLATWKAEREAQERSQAQKPRSRGR